MAIGVLVAVAGAYLIRTGRRDRERAEWAAGPPSASGPGLEAVDALEDLLASAPPIPLTDWVRVDPREATLLAESIRETVGGSQAAGEADRLAQLIARGRRIPLSEQVRVDVRRARRHLDALRLAMGAQPLR